MEKKEYNPPTSHKRKARGEINRIVLKNGIRVLLVPQKSSLATTAAVIVAAGSEYETKELNGISHFLEHMCFKGTKKRPRPIDIAGELDGLGAEYNAFTAEEVTSYFAKAQNEKTSKILEIVSDLYLNPVFNKEDIEVERGVIIEEINMYEDLPMRKVHELFSELVYGDQPAGWSIAGRKEVIKKITQDDFINYRKKHYLPQSTVVVISGGFKKQGILDEIEKHFTGIHKGPKDKKPKTTELQKEPRENVFHKVSDQTHIVMGFRAFDMHDERRFALQVLADILGGGMSSRLFDVVREKLGAAYYVRADADLSSDHGVIAMSAGVDHTKLEKVIEVSLAEFKRFKNEPVLEKELERAKEHMLGGLFLSLETSNELGYYYGMQEIMERKLVTPAELEKKVRSVTAKDIQNVARDLFKNNRLNLALIGPFKEKSFKKLLSVD